jgi:hypothetical protein
MMSRRAQIYVLIGLGVVLAVVFYNSVRSSDTGSSSGVFAENAQFQPLDVQEPRLHTDRLQKLRKLQDSGPHRNIFVAVAEPAPLAPGQQAVKPTAAFVGPKPPPPPPPLQVPAEFFGYAMRAPSGKRVAFFSSGEDVLVVAEGDTFLSRFRLVHIGNDTADVEELGTGRRTTVTMVQPPAEQTGAQ